MGVSVTSKQQLHILKGFSILLKGVFVCTNDDPVDTVSKIIWGINFNDQVYSFSTKNECKSFMKSNNIPKSEMFTLEYLIDYAGREETIKYISSNTVILYNAINPNLYETFNFNRSLDNGYPCWDIHYGVIKDKYDILEKHGVVFKKNIYKDKVKVLVNE